ncbi:MAG: tRNA preQ1(34) S-adenosylmethionine ribosyltransferase-isomerase QueA [Desulfovibrionaceae bacterium]
MDSLDELLSSYSYTLPEELLAVYPSKKRGDSRLLVIDKITGALQHSSFSSLLNFFQKPVLFVVNNSKVLPVRMTGKRKTGAKIELLLLSALPTIIIEENGKYCEAHVTVLLKGAKRCRINELLEFPFLHVTILEKMEYGQYSVLFSWSKEYSLEDIFIREGSLPLPPYLNREEEYIDEERYQSIFARQEYNGSMASPTANLHCSDNFMHSIKEHGSSLAEVTLYVGYGTFSPIRSQRITEHTMHKEYIELTEEHARRIRSAKEKSIPIVAIGTTALRVLESVYAFSSSITAFSGFTDLYIYPSYQFNVVNHLITNFHMPESSLLLLVSAFSSRKNILHAYNEAIKEQYKFFSYGDATLLL